MDSELKKKLDIIRPLFKGACGKDLWDVLVCLRGPDSPSERPNQPEGVRESSYNARVARKMKTVAIIRGNTFPGVGAARCADGDTVSLPPSNTWDHFDKHVHRAALALGLKVQIEEPAKAAGQVIEAHVKPPVAPPAPDVELTHSAGEVVGMVKWSIGVWGNKAVYWPATLYEKLFKLCKHYGWAPLDHYLETGFFLGLQGIAKMAPPESWFGSGKSVAAVAAEAKAAQQQAASNPPPTPEESGLLVGVGPGKDENALASGHMEWYFNSSEDLVPQPIPGVDAPMQYSLKDYSKSVVVPPPAAEPPAPGDIGGWEKVSISAPQPWSSQPIEAKGKLDYAMLEKALKHAANYGAKQVSFDSETAVGKMLKKTPLQKVPKK